MSTVVNLQGEPIHRTVKSFVCRNRQLTQAHEKLIDECYPAWGLPNNQDWDLDAIFPCNNPSKEVVLEIGFGTGETLIKNALANPMVNYIGIEVYRAGCINILSFLKEQPLANLKVCYGDAQAILKQHIAPASLTGVQIFFPDPWPKKKHHKRRLIQDPFVELIASKLKTDGFLHMATDWENYAEQMLTVGNSCKKFCNQADNNQYMTGLARLMTKFEQKGLVKGHLIRDLFYKKV